jgi:hypothetical protein
MNTLLMTSCHGPNPQVPALVDNCPDELFIHNPFFRVDGEEKIDYFIAIETPTVREYTIICALQGAERLSNLPFSLVPRGCEVELVFNEHSEEFRAVHLYKLLYEIANDKECETLEFLGGDFHSDCPFEQAELEGMCKAVGLLDGFDAVWDLAEKISVTKMKDMIEYGKSVSTLFCIFDV